MLPVEHLLRNKLYRIPISNVLYTDARRFAHFVIQERLLMRSRKHVFEFQK